MESVRISAVTTFFFSFQPWLNVAMGLYACVRRVHFCRGRSPGLPGQEEDAQYRRLGAARSAGRGWLRSPFSCPHG